jgi:prolyl-tRNA editing enzyme YbaK/EbsC (Cys-tRNA(Pro) deacylase)
MSHTSTMEMSSSTPKVQELLSRVEALERVRYSKYYSSCRENNNNNENDAFITVDEPMRRAHYAVETQTTLQYSAQWKFVPSQYYDTTLVERAQCLGAPSIEYLCKSLLLENRKVPTTTGSMSYDPTNPRFVLVILQYASILDVSKLISTIRRLRTDVTQRLDGTQFDFRIASESDNDRLTGYSHNSVTPFGMLCRLQTKEDNGEGEAIPIIVSSALVPLHFFWLGGGHVRLKLGLSLKDFCYAFNPIVADISRPRTRDEVEDNLDL